MFLLYVAIRFQYCMCCCCNPFSKQYMACKVQLLKTSRWHGCRDHRISIHLIPPRLSREQRHGQREISGWARIRNHQQDGYDSTFPASVFQIDEENKTSSFSTRGQALFYSEAQLLTISRRHWCHHHDL